MHRTSASCFGKLASQFSTSVQGGDTVETTESCCSFSTKGSQMKRSSRRKGDDNMMVAFKWIHAFMFLTFMLQYSDANRKYLTAHQEVTLSCENLIKDQKNCINTTWIFSPSNPQSAAIELIELGQIKSHKPGRLSLSENCSLTIKNLRGEDSGLYTCRQFNSSGSRTRPDAAIDLSVVPTTITTTASIFPGTTSATPTTHHISQSKGLSLLFSSEATTTTPATTSADDPWWLNLIAAAALVVLAIGCLTVFIYKRRKGTGGETRRNDNEVKNEENICYASISYQSTNGGAQVFGDESDPNVTYSTVRM
ncbi:uncharacterized protein isoform X2 [Takifugu rubripes]|uniref:uncharacterized protein isoform X2 n=1 Tax=Takifugu rubripes TaxID=31033 RepID=UPI001145D328|nr:uncharacterized protein LOC105417538 isoform X2 [Takifugu rubripes]